MRRLFVMICTATLAHCAAETPGFEGATPANRYMGPIPASFQNELSKERLSLAAATYRWRYVDEMALYQVNSPGTTGIDSCRALNALTGEMMPFSTTATPDAFALTPGTSCYALTKEQNLKFSGSIAAALASLDLATSGNAFPDTCASLMQARVSDRAEQSFALIPVVGVSSAWGDRLVGLTGEAWVGGNQTHLASRMTMTAELQNPKARYQVTLAIWAEQIGDLKMGRVETYETELDGRTETTIVKTDVTADMENLRLAETTSVKSLVDGKVTSDYVNQLALTPKDGTLAVSLDQRGQDDEKSFNFSFQGAEEACQVR